jgi:hypothetical protein
MIPEQRDGKGRLRVPFFVGLISEYMEGQATYEANEFKEHVLRLGILAAKDWDVESNGYVKWKHRIDRAAQRYFTNV